MTGRCPGCDRRLGKKGGSVRYVDEKGVSREISICEDCSRNLEQMDDCSVTFSPDRDILSS